MKTPLKQNLFSKLVTSGTYKVWCGESFYIGSAVDIDKRRQDHALQLRRGCHHSKPLQAAFDALPEPTDAEFEVVQQMPGATVAEIRAAEQALLDDLHGTPGCCNASKTSIGATNPRPDAVLRWQNPEFRAKMKLARDNYRPSEGTRKLMGDAKRGANNPKARAVVLVFKGVESHHPSATAAAIHVGATQQAMHLWLSGQVRWPGSDLSRKYRMSKAAKRLIGLTGHFVD